MSGWSTRVTCFRQDAPGVVESLFSLLPFFRFLNLSGRPVSRVLLREGVTVSGTVPVPVESPSNLVVCMHLRIFAHSSKILMAIFDPFLDPARLGNGLPL